MTDSLKTEVEKAMREFVIHDYLPPRTGEEMIFLQHAIAVAVEMIEEERANMTGTAVMRFAGRAEAAANKVLGNAVTLEEAIRQTLKKTRELEDQLEAAEEERDDARKAVAYYRENWGHVACCECGIDSPEPSQRAFRDPRCAPAPKEKAGE